MKKQMILCDHYNITHFPGSANIQLQWNKVWYSAGFVKRKTRFLPGVRENS